MTTSTTEDAIPRGAVIAGAGLIIFALLATAAARLTEVGTVRLAPITATESKVLTFEPRADGSMLVRDVSNPSSTYIVPATGNEGFVRVALQSLIRERDALGIKPDAPYRLIRQDGGRLWLEDLATQRRLTLDAFGSGNAKVFAKFLDAKLLDDRKVMP
jgi:putative photosynthetic complex assembly protein